MSVSLSLSTTAVTERNIAHIANQDFSIVPVAADKNKFERFLLNINDNIYYVGVNVFHILEQIRTGSSLKDVTLYINGLQEEHDFSEVEVSTIIDEQILKLFDKKQKAPPPVKSLLKILNPQKFSDTLSPLCTLFTPAVFKPLFVTLLLLNGLYFGLVRMAIIQPVDVGHTSAQEGAVYFFFLFLFLVFHEIGHAVASMSFGITPKKIGFGIYFIFPAFYTDLTDVWKLNNRERIIINLGGIYFQLLVNVFLLTGLAFFVESPVWAYYVHRLIMLNIVISLYNINPFFRFDGYWIYSDYFDLPNLRKQSNQLIGRTFIKIRNVFTGRKNTSPVNTVDVTYPLAVYSVAYMLFMGMVWYYISGFIVKSHVDLYAILSTPADYDTTSVSWWSSLLVLMFFVSIPWGITGLNIYKRLKK